MELISQGTSLGAFIPEHGRNLKAALLSSCRFLLANFGEVLAAALLFFIYLLMLLFKEGTEYSIQCKTRAHVFYHLSL